MLSVTSSCPKSLKPTMPKNRDIIIDITREYNGWDGCDFNIEDTIQAAVRASIEKSMYADDLLGKPGEISIVLGDDDFVRNLNRDYRHKDKATNVLSFPQTDFTDKHSLQAPIAFGDVILAYETIKDEAKDQDKPFQSHFTHLVVHGTLHLMGYDHENESEAAEMEALEVNILKEMGIENPYS